MTIRRATSADLPSTLALIAAVVAHMQSQNIDQWDNLYPDSATIEQDLADGTLHIATDESISAGSQAIIVLNEIQPPEYAAVDWGHRAEKILVVHRLAVHPAQQRCGIASELMAFAEARASAEGYAAIRLDTFVGNPAANHLYVRRGYRFAGTVTFRKGLFNCYEKLSL